MVGTAFLMAITIVLQMIGNYISIGPVNINLSLLPIAMAAIMYGPWSGLLVGLTNSVLTLIAPGTAVFLQENMFWTIVCCLAKTGLAGLIPGFIFKLFKGKAQIAGMFVVAILVPLINTGIFTICCFTIFRSLVESWAGSGSNVWIYYVTAVVGWNFVFEVGSSLALAPTMVHVIKIVTKNYNIGDNLTYYEKKEKEVTE